MNGNRSGTSKEAMREATREVTSRGDTNIKDTTIKDTIAEVMTTRDMTAPKTKIPLIQSKIKASRHKITIDTTRSTTSATIST